MLPTITNTNDLAANTTDDVANLPPKAIYPSTPFIVDVRGPSFTTGDVTWSVLDAAGSPVAGVVTAGQNTIEATLTFNNSLPFGEYTIKACLTSNLTDCSTYKVQLVETGSMSQFCVETADIPCDEQVTKPCCEITVEPGEQVALKVPTFHLRINGNKEEIRYSDVGYGQSGESGYLKSGSTVTDAKGNTISCSASEALFEIVTSVDMADVANGAFGIGFSSQDNGSGVNTIDTGVVWYTDTAVRYVEIRQNGTAVSASKRTIALGDIVSAGYKDGVFVMYINNMLQYTSTIICPGREQFLDIAITTANKALGGNLSGLTWSIVTAGSTGEVGSINQSGIYTAPSGGSSGLIVAEASVGNAKFRVNLRMVRPTLRYTSPKAFLAGKAPTVWVGPYIPGFNEPVRLAKDGSPDAIQNTYKGVGMIDLGTLEGSANFSLTRDYQDFTNDLGHIYHTSISSESATLAATFLEVRDLYKMNTLLPDSHLWAKQNGVTEFSVGGSGCSVRELRVIMVIGRPGCDDQFDVLYFPRVQNKGNLGFEIGRRANAKYEMTLTAIPDYTRPEGKQLFSIYQIDVCTGNSCNV
jgi:hypothetical protein